MRSRQLPAQVYDAAVAMQGFGVLGELVEDGPVLDYCGAPLFGGGIDPVTVSSDNVAREGTNAVSCKGHRYQCRVPTSARQAVAASSDSALGSASTPAMLSRSSDRTTSTAE